jgi:hypothetical protein
MPDPVNLNEPAAIAAALNGAALRGRPVAVAHVRADGSPSLTFRGSAYVRSSTEVAMWARKRDSGLATAIADHPRVSLALFEPEGPGARYVAIEGRARVTPDLNDEVYGAIIEREQQQDAERNGVAVIVEVDSVTAATADGFIKQGND